MIHSKIEHLAKKSKPDYALSVSYPDNIHSLLIKLFY